MRIPRFRLLRPSTRAFLAEARRRPGFSWMDWLHSYVYLRWPYFYISVGTGEHPLARLLGPPAMRLLNLFYPRKPASLAENTGARKITFADTYHGKVVPVEAARQLISLNREIALTNLEQVIPYARARDIILHNPDHIVVLQCPCRTARAEPCLPLDVCLIVGQPFAGFVIEHHPDRARRITVAEAAAILQAEHERGHVQHAFFKDVMLGRFYAICNCCACCCGAMQAHRNGVPMLASSGYVGQVDPAACAGCGACVDFCQFGALSLAGDRIMVDPDRCMGCGVCVARCPYAALSLSRDPARGEPLEIHRLMAAAGLSEKDNLCA